MPLTRKMTLRGSLQLLVFWAFLWTSLGSFARSFAFAAQVSSSTSSPSPSSFSISRPFTSFSSSETEDPNAEPHPLDPDLKGFHLISLLLHNVTAQTQKGWQEVGLLPNSSSSSPPSSSSLARSCSQASNQASRDFGNWFRHQLNPLLELPVNSSAVSHVCSLRYNWPWKADILLRFRINSVLAPSNLSDAANSQRLFSATQIFRRLQVLLQDKQSSLFQTLPDLHSHFFMHTSHNFPKRVNKYDQGNVGMDAAAIGGFVVVTLLAGLSVLAFLRNDCRRRSERSLGLSSSSSETSFSPRSPSQRGTGTQGKRKYGEEEEEEEEDLENQKTFKSSSPRN